MPFWITVSTGDVIAGDHRPEFGRHILFHHKNVLAYLPGLNRLRRDDDSIGLSGEGERDIHELARPEPVVWVVECRL